MAAGDDRVSVFEYSPSGASDIPGALETALQTHLQGLKIDTDKAYDVSLMERTSTSYRFLICYTESA